MDLLLRGGTLVGPAGLSRGDLLVQGGKIARVAPSLDPASLPRGGRLVDCSGLLVFPGFVDAHTHFGLGEGEDRTADGFYEGSVAAALGGVTSFVDFADQIPGRTLLEGAEARIGEAADSVIDFSLHQGVYRFHPGLGGELEELAARGLRALKLFTTYGKFGVRLDAASWEPLFALCAERKFLVTIHAEDDEVIDAAERRLAGGLADAGSFVPGPSLHPLLRPAAAEASAILAAGRKALRQGLPLYFVHVSSAAGLEAARKLRRRGLAVALETAPHYLLLDDEKLGGRDGALFLMTPPLRTPADRAALNEALASGEIDVLATDHCAYRPEQKRKNPDCREVPAGVPGTGEAASLFFTLYPGDDAEKAKALCGLFSANPAKLFGLFPRKGCLEPGSDADLAVFDPRASGTISKASTRTAAGYSAYEGMSYSGAAVMTISKGEVIAEGGRFEGRRGAGGFLACGLSDIYLGRA